jgi:hypothetical protein
VYCPREEESGRALIQAWMFYSLGYLLAGEDRLKEAEAMYERALRGSEKALGAKHTCQPQRPCSS